MRIFYWFGVLVFVWLRCVKKAIWDLNHFLYRLVTNPSLQPHSHSLLVPGPSWGLYGASQVVLVVKKLPAKARDTGDAGSVPGSRRSPGGGHGHPLQYSCLENPMDGRASWTTKQSTAKRQTLLKSWHTLSAGALWCEFTCSLCVSLQVPGYQHLESPNFWRCLPGISLWLFFFFMA